VVNINEDITSIKELQLIASLPNMVAPIVTHQQVVYAALIMPKLHLILIFFFTINYDILLKWHIDSD